jgi:NitT/TauT family transport system substrate-binding protein
MTMSEALRPNRRDALALVAGAVTLPAARAVADAQTLPLVRVAYIPYEFSAQVLYAQEMDFFRKAGIAVELQPNPYSASIASAVAAGAIDVGISTTTTLAIAHSKGVPFTIIAPAAEYRSGPYSDGSGYLMVGKQTNIHTGADMNGKVVGAPGLSSLGEFGVRAWVDANGGDATSLKFVELPISEMAGAFATGRIDAAFVAPPFVDDCVKVARQLTPNEMDAIAKDFLVTAWFTTGDWAKAHPDLVVRFAAALRDASTWAPKNAATCAQILAKTLKANLADIAKAPRVQFAGRLTPAILQPIVTMTARYSKFANFPAEALIYTPGR